MPATDKRTALQAYMENQAVALALIERIQEAIENHDTVPAPEEIHWGHVSEMGRIRGLLQEVSDCLFAEGEYAPEAN